MSSASKWLALAALATCCLAASNCPAAPLLRVCADPNNLPYSNQQQEGFENRMASLFAGDLGMQVSYVWYPQRGAFFRKTLDAGICDVVMGVPAGMDEAITTRPYYFSSYAFLTRRDRHLRITSFDDPRLRTLRIGVHVLGDQDDNLPPVHALISRGIVRNLVGYSIFGNLGEKNPAADLIDAVIHNEVDIAVVWGPLAGYFARQSPVPLEITPIPADPQHPALPMVFSIRIGVRPRDEQLRQQLDAEVERRQPEIQRLLASYGIPQVSAQNIAQGGN
jgi:quinoprotein dehydrogenase-associated probable ABC transporter substrate-binding protein